MLTTRVMPCLLLQGTRLVKTVKFKDPDYVGDPINAIKIYNEKEVDELIFLDITATTEKRGPPFKMITRIADECFMPLTYGGGIRSIADMEKLYSMGVEKIAVNSYAVERPGFVTEAAKLFGNQAIVASIDAKKTLLGYKVFTDSGKKDTGLDPAAHAKEMERMGAGEILLTSIDRDGTMDGYDLELITAVTSAVNVPVIACGGAGRVEHFAEAVKAGASACAAGSMVVYQSRHRGVLINFPTQNELAKALGERR